MITVNAYAKLNLILNVKGKRPDGYHEIETFFQAIDLCDRVTVERSDHCGKDSCGFLPSGRFLPDIRPENNLAMKALAKAKEAFGDSGCYRISIEKNIPLAGGLGGGSADAAAVLTALAKLWELEDLSKMYEIASQLGSDVPFCLASQNGHPAAIGRGRGEILEFAEPVRMRVDLYESKTALEAKTAAVYGALLPEDYVIQYDVASFMKAGSIEEKKKYMGNHLQPALERLTGKKEDMMLCGAGPTYFRIDQDGKYGTVTG